MLKRRDYFTSNWQDDSQVKWVEDTGIELIRGRGWITAPRRVEVAGLDGNSYALTARHAVVLATGSTPNRPPVEGLDDIEYWTTREATSAREVPARLAVLGGGVAGVELAQAYARLGASVTLVARRGLLGMFPEQAAELVAAGLRADGVELRLNTGTRSVSKNDDGSLTWCSTVAPRAGRTDARTALPRRRAHGGQTARRHRPAPRPRRARPGQRRARGARGKALRLSTDSTGLVHRAAENETSPGSTLQGTPPDGPC